MLGHSGLLELVPKPDQHEGLVVVLLGPGPAPAVGISHLGIVDTLEHLGGAVPARWHDGEPAECPYEGTT